MTVVIIRVDREWYSYDCSYTDINLACYYTGILLLEEFYKRSYLRRKPRDKRVAEIPKDTIRIIISICKRGFYCSNDKKPLCLEDNRKLLNNKYAV